MQRLLTHYMHPVHRHAALLVVVGFCLFAVFGVGISDALAQTSFEQFADASTLSQDSIGIIIARLIRVFLTVTGVILTVIVVYAGFIYMTAQGEPAKVEKAKNMIKNAVIGLFLIFSSYAITTFILNALLDAAFGSESTAVADSYSEPLSAALGGGILDDHYPIRGATEIPRNTNIFVTFKKPIELSTIIKDYDSDPTSTDLNVNSVLIYKTQDGSTTALGESEVEVSFTEDQEIFVFNPVDYLGSSTQDTNYTVVLTSNIETDSGDSAFTTSAGYEWTFEVSTEIDLTPPHVTSVVPAQDSEEARNVTIEINFSEAMNPVAVTGTFDTRSTDSTLWETFSNIAVEGSTSGQVNGTFEISNGYKTVGFTTLDACGEDPCGDLIYCLPGDENIETTVKAATINEDDPPQAVIGSTLYDGAVDAASNSLDGDDDETACGSDSNDIDCPDGDSNDNYVWDFDTTDVLEDTVPHITGRQPEISEGEISRTEPATATFNGYLKSSTVDTDSASLWPDPYYSMWFTTRLETDADDDGIDDGAHTIVLNHPTFVSTDEGGWDYWPVMTNEIKSNYQICMFPAMDDLSCSATSESAPWCCAGSPSSSECQTSTQETLSAPESGDIVLPDNSETEGL